MYMYTNNAHVNSHKSLRGLGALTLWKSCMNLHASILSSTIGETSCYCSLLCSNHTWRSPWWGMTQFLHFIASYLCYTGPPSHHALASLGQSEGSSFMASFWLLGVQLACDDRSRGFLIILSPQGSRPREKKIAFAPPHNHFLPADSCSSQRSSDPSPCLWWNYQFPVVGVNLHLLIMNYLAFIASRWLREFPVIIYFILSKVMRAFIPF